MVIQTRILPFKERADIHRWLMLQSEIRDFSKEGILYPVNNPAISPSDRFLNRSENCVRKIPRLLYDRIVHLPYAQKKLLIPHAKGLYTIIPRSRPRSPAWKGDTEYMRRKFDRWYWEMRGYRIPFTTALRRLLTDVHSGVQRRVFLYHVDMTIERNRVLQLPPMWLQIEQSRC